MSDVESFDGHDAVVEEVKSVSISQAPSVADSSMASLVHINRSADAIVTSYDDLDLEFETFNGSMEDNVEKPEPEPVAIGQAPGDEDEFHFVSPKLSSNNLISSAKSSSTVGNETDGSMVNSTSIEGNGEAQPLNVLKTREINLPVQEYRRKTSNFKAVKVSSDKPMIPAENEQKIKELTNVCAKFDHKISKIIQEVEYLDYLNAHTPSLEEISKLKRAKEALLDKLESVKKEKYNSTVKLNHLVLKSPSIRGGDYWLRNVS